MDHTKVAAFIYGDNPHHIDHLVPLCELLDIPLIVTEKHLAQNIKRYYPFITPLLYRYTDNPEKLISAFDTLFYTTPRVLFEEVFFFAQRLLKKQVRTIWCPHGNSDKGHHSYFMKALGEETHMLVYGPKMIDFLKEKNVYHQLETALSIGNIRYQHYLKHQARYDAIAQMEIIRHLSKNCKTILYAPTWMDAEDNSSFFSVIDHLTATLPKHYNLIIKLHPNLLFSHADKITPYIAQTPPNICYVKQFYMIYPLLNQIDIYLGDMSSIGYDALTFNIPLFFLNHKNLPSGDPSLYLTRCGTLIAPNQYPYIYSIIEQTLPKDKQIFEKTRKEVYDYTFRQQDNLKQHLTTFL